MQAKPGAWRAIAKPVDEDHVVLVTVGMLTASTALLSFLAVWPMRTIAALI